jgi:MoxR-like ATPase|tara:strand:+ start:275 stop:568 length:294 start_codon:yes stop_codon:yes gene_type:complete
MSRFKIINNVKIPLTAEENAIEDQKEKTHKENELNRKLNHLRSTRDYLISKTDWTANSDVTMSDAMKTYRQQLRDATEGLDTVEKVQAYEFPTEVTK